jgi:hypothetical protein
MPSITNTRTVTLELLLELRVGFLEMQVLRLLVVDAFFQSSEFSVITYNFPQFF